MYTYIYTHTDQKIQLSRIDICDRIDEASPIEVPTLKDGKVRVCIYVYIYVLAYIHAYMYCVYLCIYTHVFRNTYMYICICTCVYKSVEIYMYMFTHTHVPALRL